MQEKTEVLDSSGEPIKSQKLVELNDVKGNHITIEDAKATLTRNSDLVQRVINGESKAFNELYVQSYRYVFFVIRQYIPDDETTYDAIQETFIKVYKNISGLREPAAYYSWLTSVAKNTAVDILRTKPSESELVYEEKNDSAIKDEQTNKDVSLDIETVLKKLDPAEADLLSLVYYDGMRVSQIAKMQGIPATTVYSRLKKAKQNLKSQLAVHGIDKAIYSGNFVAMITTAIRNIIGTALLSFAIAQQILNTIIGKHSKKELAIANIIKAHQKKMALKIASWLIAICIFASCFTVLALTDWGRAFVRDVKETVETITEYHYYNESQSDENDSPNESGDNLHGGNSSKEDTSSQENNVSSGNFWQNLFGGSSTDSKNTSDTNTSDDVSYPSSQQSKPSSSSNNSQNTLYPNGQSPNSTPQESNTENIIPPDITPDANQYANVFGNNPNNVMRTIASDELGGLVAKQGDWLYYVQSGTRLVKIKTDGSARQILYEATGFTMISSLNVIGDTVYYTNGGIWSIKTDGTERRQISSKTAYNLLVRGTTGWFVVPDKASDTPAIYMHYSLYQIDLLTGEVITIVENGAGYGLKTVIDNSLIYVNGNNLYKRDLSTGTESLIKQFDFERGIYNMCANGNTIYFCGGSSDKEVVEIEINNPDVIKVKYKFGNVYNYFNFGGGVLYGRIEVGEPAFYTLQGEMLFGDNANIRCDTGVYTFDDGYAYYYDEDLSELYCCMPDGTDYKVY